MNGRRAGLAFVAVLALAGSGRAGEGGGAPGGKSLYDEHCYSCHQFDGGGVPNFQPSIRNSELVQGPPGALAAFVLRGTADLPPAARRYDNVMPAFDTLSNADLARLLTYIRSTFDNSAPPVAKKTVRRARRQLD